MNIIPAPAPHLIAAQVAAAIAEDLGQGDHTAQLTPNHTVQAQVITREPCVLCGTPWFDEVFRQLDPEVRIEWLLVEGSRVDAEATLCTLSGPARSLLTGERTALNFLQTLSATATVTRQYADQMAGTKARVLDTRKTIPGLRLAQKYAVRIGGGDNQRLALYDGILIKENHILAAGSIAAVLAEARRLAPPGVSIQIEVENLDQLQQALEAGATLILLDNMSLDAMREAARMSAGRALLEASGNVSMDNIAAIAATGVDRISVGGLTKHIKAIDLSLRLR